MTVYYHCCQNIQQNVFLVDLHEYAFCNLLGQACSNYNFLLMCIGDGKQYTCTYIGIHNTWQSITYSSSWYLSIMDIQSGILRAACSTLLINFFYWCTRDCKLYIIYVHAENKTWQNTTYNAHQHLAVMHI